MMDDRFDEFLREAAQDYQRPPETPREEIWARIEAARRPRRAEVVDLAERRRRRWRRYRGPLALAATLVLGVAVGRLTLRSSPSDPAPGPVTPEGGAPRTSLAARLAAVEHLTMVEVLLTDYEAGKSDADFVALTRDLLATTRLWLDSDRITDPKLRSLLLDLELVLVQIAQLPAQGRSEERALIDQGMADRQIRPRLRTAIPAGPTA
jgi:hypothetical protein